MSIVPERPFDRYLVSQSQMKLTLNRKAADPVFFHHVFTSRQQQEFVRRSTIQTGLPHINLGILRCIPVQRPSLAEQEAIAEALSDADALVESLEHLIAKKRLLKQGAMQELLTGKRMLPGFSGAWEVKPLGSLLTVRHGRDQRGIVVPDGEYPILASGGEIGRTNTYLHPGPSVLIGRKGTIDSPQFCSTPFWTIDTLFFTEMAEGVSASFMFYKFWTISWRSHNEASGVPSLNARTIEAIRVCVPPEAEQAAIAAVLSDMDAELAALEVRLSKASQIKQGMMHQLLTGRIRLV